MELPEAIEDERRRPGYHITLVLDNITVTEPSTTGSLDTCLASGRVEGIHRKPPRGCGRVKRAPSAGESFSISVRCWDETRRPELPGPRRLHYGGTSKPRRIQVWGSIINDEFIESGLDQDIVSMEPERRENIRIREHTLGFIAQGLRTAKQYRDEFPRASQGKSIDDSIRKAFSTL